MPREELIQPRAGTAAEWAAAEVAGPALVAGEWAYVTDENVFVVGDGATKVVALDRVGFGGVTGGLLAASNLSDLASASTARTNLGLGAAATKSLADIAADTALTSAYVPAVILSGSGIDPTGVADSTTAIQAKITALAEGQTLVGVPGATYKVSSVLTVTQDRVILDFGNSKLVRTGTAGEPILTASGRDFVDIRSALIDAGNINLGGKGAITYINCTNSTVQSCRITNLYSTSVGVLGQGIQRCKIIRNVIAGGGYGVVVGSLSANGSPETNDNLIDGNTVTSTEMDSIFVTASLGSTATTNVGYRNIISNNTVTGCGDAGIESGIGMRDNVISGNTVTGSHGPNILVRDNDGTQVTGNSSTGSTTYINGYDGGIAVVDQTSTSQNIVITHNVCHSNTGHGIRLAPNSAGNSTGHLIVGNQCRNNTHRGISTEAATGVSITGNVARRNGDHGICMTAPGDGKGDAAISGNVCAENTGMGIRVESSNVLVSGNRCYDQQSTKTQTYGVGIIGTQANYCTVMDNDLSGNLTGPFSDTGTGNYFSNNRGDDGNYVRRTAEYETYVSNHLKVGGYIWGGATGFGANGTYPVAKPTVTGSRGSNAALASLLTALASEGLITDSSS